MLGEIKFCNFKNKNFEKKSPKTFLYFMTIFHNAALKVEISFKLQRCLKLEKPMINLKTSRGMLKTQQTTTTSD